MEETRILDGRKAWLQHRIKEEEICYTICSAMKVILDENTTPAPKRLFRADCFIVVLWSPILEQDFITPFRLNGCMDVALRGTSN